MDIDVNVQAALDAQVLQRLVDHITNCLCERSHSAASAALVWLQEMVDCEGLILCQFHRNNYMCIEQIINISYSLEWVDIYRDQDFQRIDPVLGFSLDKTDIFRWSHAYKGYDKLGAKVFIEAAQDFGLMDGFAYSITTQDKSDKDKNLATICSLSTDSPVLPETTVYIIKSILPALNIAISNPVLPPPNPLTKRELETLKWAEKGKTAWEIGRLLYISEPTVKFHLANIYRKLNVTTRAQAISHAIHIGWL